MLKSFQIKNFRLFQRIKVKNLNRVNLIVGKNNSGKSTFLEALQLYVSNASRSVILDQLASRRETWVSGAKWRDRISNNSIRHLFFEHKLPQVGHLGILLGEIGSEKKLHLSTATYQQQKDSEGGLKLVRVPNDQLKLTDDYFPDSFLFVVVEEGEKLIDLLGLETEIIDIASDDFRRFYKPNPNQSDFKLIWQMISTESMSNRELAALWDLTSLTNLESEVISALHLIDERVTGVAFVEDVNRRNSEKNRIPLVKIKGIEEPLPLKSMGDGMNRLFHIIVALVNAKNGILLIDEFENGLHWSVQPKLWDIVFQLSEKLNVQIFATTHSRDCILGFDKAWNKYPELGAFFRLDNKDGSIKVTEYTAETLTDSLEMDVEVR